MFLAQAPFSAIEHASDYSFCFFKFSPAPQYYGKIVVSFQCRWVILTQHLFAIIKCPLHDSFRFFEISLVCQYYGKIADAG